MLERDLAKQFDTVFIRYQLWKPRDKLAGWPDRGVQHKSSIIWIELKKTSFRLDNRIVLDNFKKEQAAFMYKWQNFGGRCLLLVAIDDYYAVITRMLAADWLTLNKQQLAIDKFTLYTNDIKDVVTWFEQSYIR
jgi:penicillin-binding protein-related factor A (putative recombinase)